MTKNWMQYNGPSINDTPLSADVIYGWSLPKIAELEVNDLRLVRENALAFDCFCEEDGCGLFGNYPGSGVITFDGCSGNKFNAR